MHCRSNYEHCDVIAMSEYRIVPAKAAIVHLEYCDIVPMARHVQIRDGPSITNVAISSPDPVVPVKPGSPQLARCDIVACKVVSDCGDPTRFATSNRSAEGVCERQSSMLEIFEASDFMESILDEHSLV